MPMNPTKILSLGFTLADRIPDGRINGALATAVASRKRRLDKGRDFIREKLPKPPSLKSLFSAELPVGLNLLEIVVKIASYVKFILTLGLACFVFSEL